MITKLWPGAADGIFSKPVVASCIRWQRILRRSSTMKGFCNKILLIVFDKLSKETCILLALFCREVIRRSYKSGMLSTAMQLKQASSCLMMYYGGVKTPKQLLSVPISLTRSGLPRIIPRYHRQVIMRRNDRSDDLVKCYLSFFSVYRVVLLAPKISVKTFKSIVSPWENPDRVERTVASIKEFIELLSYRYLPEVTKIPLYQGATWMPTWKSLPSHPLFRESVMKTESLRKKYRKVRSSFHTFFWEMIAYGSLLQIEHANEGLFSSGVLWYHRVRYALDREYNIRSTESDLNWFEKCVGPMLPTGEQCRLPWLGGRLSFKLDGGGKRRVFAIGNYVKQRLLHPYHVWLMKLLRTLPMDGTHDQLRPLRRLYGHKEYFSYDLTAATDRWPLYLLFSIFRHWFGHNLSGSVVNTTLGHNVFSISTPKGWKSLCFVAGQPLGYYMSWPLFAISHHFVVWYCADLIYPGRYFSNYAVLGDDLVIADARVAKVYRQVVNDLGVKISDSKSLVSNTGCFEFAKRFIVRGGSKDLSPISFRSLLQFPSYYGLLGIHHKYPVKRFSTLLRIGGMGYRVLGKYLHTPSRRVRRLKVLFDFPYKDYPLELWLGRGLPLSPYTKGDIVTLLLHKFKPKDMVYPPEELHPSDGVNFMHEKTLLYNWVKEWLKYTNWYWNIAQRPESHIEDYFDRPVVEVSWKAKTERSQKETLVNFGILLKLYDSLKDRNLSWYKPSLTPLIVSNKDFLYEMPRNIKVSSAPPYSFNRLYEGVS